MIIDFHTHIFPKAIRENRQKYFPNESAFKLLYSSPGSKLVGATEIVISMENKGNLSGAKRLYHGSCGQTPRSADRLVLF
jgi:hypothetical protein